MYVVRRSDEAGLGLVDLFIGGGVECLPSDVPDGDWLRCHGAVHF